ncbi:MAG: 30S ribosomal protein S6 [Phycisphaerales bacterium]|nr:30S ribosomal protein S6 [Phycisphaerales bacterium]
MTETRIYPYEGMFLFPQSATADLEGSVKYVTEILERHGATIDSLVKWDERRLAYDIKANKRGLYILTYFHAKSSALVEIERECNLSERLLRSLLMRADHLTPDQMKDADGQAKLAMEMRLRKAMPDAVEVEAVEE